MFTLWYVVNVLALVLFFTYKTQNLIQIALDPAIRQGQTRYPFLVTQFQRDEDLEVDLNMEEYVWVMSLCS